MLPALYIRVAIITSLTVSGVSGAIRFGNFQDHLLSKLTTFNGVDVSNSDRLIRLLLLAGAHFLIPLRVSSGLFYFDFPITDRDMCTTD